MALVERFGKVYELGLALLINLRMLTPFKDIDMASPMLMKGKLKPFPHFSHGSKRASAGDGSNSETGKRLRTCKRSEERSA